jgi:2-dehydro-3-deoxyphosphogluconate aldolase/(4S)-4-hydroxy-2-oxoglutarate aldolase
MAGARFAVSPGYTSGDRSGLPRPGLPLLPGVATGSEILMCQEDGLTELKFFPALQAGGSAMLKAWGGPFGDVRFCPTGGISRQRGRVPGLAQCRVCRGLLAGARRMRWHSGDWARITQLAREAAVLGRKAG